MYSGKLRLQVPQIIRLSCKPHASSFVFRKTKVLSSLHWIPQETNRLFYPGFAKRGRDLWISLCSSNYQNVGEFCSHYSSNSCIGPLQWNDPTSRKASIVSIYVICMYLSQKGFVWKLYWKIETEKFLSNLAESEHQVLKLLNRVKYPCSFIENWGLIYS